MTGLPPTPPGPLAGLCPQPRWCSVLDDSPPPPLPDHPEAYRLVVRNGEAHIDATSEVGEFRARATLSQLQRCSGGEPDDVEIVDWPALDHRGVMLDVSRDCAPTLQTLEITIARLAAMGINHVELYLEAHFDHPGHDDTTAPNHPYSPDEVAHLRRFAAAHHVELVGQQNSLGHMERWLANPRHAHLAALPGGYHTPDGTGHEPPACLDPTSEEAWALASELVTNVAVAFDAGWVHLGLDEPLDLDVALWDAIFDVGDGPSPWSGVDNGAFCVPLPPRRREQYVAWVRRLVDLPALAGRRLLMWADVVAPHPELAGELPDEVVLVEWGYDADHPFDARCGRLAAAGRAFWAAPGTAGWTAIGGRIPTMEANISAAVAAVVAHGGSGVLVTRWETLPEIADWPGFVLGAALGWNPERAPRLAGALDVAVAQGSGLGEAWEIVGTIDAGLPAIPERGSASEMFRSGGMAGVGLALVGMTPDDLDAVDRRLARARTALDVAVTEAPDGELLRAELAWVVDALRWGTAAGRHRLGWEGDPGAERLRDLHATLVATYAQLWHARHRPGGSERVAAVVADTLGGI